MPSHLAPSHSPIPFHPSQTTEGLDDVAVVCALQRSGNQMGRAREFLDSPLIRAIFKESQAVRVGRRAGVGGGIRDEEWKGESTAIWVHTVLSFSHSSPASPLLHAAFTPTTPLQMRDLKLLRETLTMDEIAGVLAARSSMVVKRKGLNLGDLDFSGVRGGGGRWC